MFVNPINKEYCEGRIIAINTAVSALWPRAKEIAKEKVSKLPIANDEHALNVKTDCAIRARLAQYYVITRSKLTNLRELLEFELLHHHPYWDGARRAWTSPMYFLEQIADTNPKAKTELEEYDLLLESAREAINEYLEAGNKLPDPVECANSLKR